MPLYDYECTQCKYTEEQLHKHSESPVYKCGSCGTILVKQVGGGSMFDLKGDGYYKPGKDVGSK